ncbi:MAG TPA: tryptophan--tRNA ligase [Cryomorphaceae bacterium]|jgi:tryptophanyl-tRNA synthetase|nr:MAG: tryptophan--tRNA ligase [Cryomorphaceae bacterium BACL7 MAG-120910-bin2]KRO69153.1 MAG: tryptophan--tRNA ligase [Cryomorphaceae bacterium BACL7 MAG-120322-bin74]KRO83902.1 MAG: tryptophan--tRNA ligase [Cryomorphaceae bacterium BACL7 MAG-121220-bin83]NQW24939.1 tryptophan--tRNA ligase [Cryomorphaceae bacterium]HAB31163.1 tryptophan--tRNA ligase [Cryomorphaceae bacterium]
MARILTGIQSSGRQHLGNILGAIKPAIALANDPSNDAYLFIADLHSLTSVKDPIARKENLLATAAAWLACGLDPDKAVFYAQSHLPECTELTWYLNCYTPFPMLANAHSFKDKSDRLADVNAGLFDYPVLMASDILLYDADVVPVGKDQRQHVEMTRDIAEAFNRQTATETFVIPEARIDEAVMTIPGTDGQKMSKSYGNVIDIFLPEKALKKQIMSIVTDSKALEDPKDPNTCNVVQLYRLVAHPDQVVEMEAHYRAGGYGYGHAKTALFEVLLTAFEDERKRFDAYVENPQAVYQALALGAEKARPIAQATLGRVRAALGF